MKKKHLKRDRVLVLGCLPRIGFFDHKLPLPTPFNGGVLATVSPSVKSYSYCPIDLSVALLQSYIDGSTLTNLKNFFDTANNFDVESKIHLTVLDTRDNSIESYPIAIWKHLRSSLELNLINQFCKAGKYTFKELL